MQEISGRINSKGKRGLGAYELPEGNDLDKNVAKDLPTEKGASVGDWHTVSRGANVE